MRVLFLDIDGVLNHEDTGIYFEDEKVRILNKILTTTDANLVVTSTWRLGATPEEMDALLSSQGVLPGRVIGVTPYLDDQRGMEIQEWLKTWTSRYQIEKIVILDDRSDLAPVDHSLIRTSKTIGLTEQDANLAIQFLNSNPTS
jgi:hypothetical protein